MCTVRQEHMGYAVAMNRGIQESTGSLLAFQDADDLWEPEKLEQRFAAIDAKPDVDAVFGHMECFLSPDVDPEAAGRYPVPPAMAAYQLTTMLIRRPAFERVGALDPGAETTTVIEWISRAHAAPCGCSCSMLWSLDVASTTATRAFARRRSATPTCSRRSAPTGDAWIDPGSARSVMLARTEDRLLLRPS